MATPKTTINIHPKLFTGMLVGLAVAIVGAVAGAIDPSMFNALGVWAAPAFSLATTGLAVLGGWLKRVNATETPVGTETVRVTMEPAVRTPSVTAPVVAPNLPADPVVPSAPIQVQLVNPTAVHTDAAPAGTQSSVIA